MVRLGKALAAKVNTSNSQQLGLGRADDALSAKSDMICEALPESLSHPPSTRPRSHQIKHDKLISGLLPKDNVASNMRIGFINIHKHNFQCIYIYAGISPKRN
jgi:hypothetical protein